MRPITFTLQYAAAVTNSVATLQTLGAAGPLTLNGSLVTQTILTVAGNANAATIPVATLAPQGYITLTSTNNLSAVSFTITGADKVGNVISEVLTGPNANTVTSAKSYTTITSITASAAATAVSAGTASGGYTNFIPLDIYPTTETVDIQATLVSGTATYSVVYTNEDPFNTAITPAELAVNASLTSATASVNYQSTGLLRALKVYVAAGSTGLLRFTFTQQSTR